MDSEEKRMRMAVIAGAAQAANYLKKNWKASEDEVIQHVTDNVEKILKEIDDPL